MNIVTEKHCTFRGREEWTAVDDDTYDGPESPIGSGHTEQEAIDDLCEQIGLPYSYQPIERTA